MSNVYKVGYGRPPRHAQFKKGTSGNPRGRPKKIPSLEGMHRKLLFEGKRVLRQYGKARRVCNLEAVYNVVLIEALNGNLRAAELLFKLAGAVAAADLAAQEAEDPHAKDARLLAEALKETFLSFDIPDESKGDAEFRLVSPSPGVENDGGEKPVNLSG